MIDRRKCGRSSRNFKSSSRLQKRTSKNFPVESATTKRSSEPLNQTATERDLGASNGEPLDTKAGGPFRFLIPNAAECKTAEMDTCANVKFLDRIELTAGKGRDTR
jgi:hypothetical protein